MAVLPIHLTTYGLMQLAAGTFGPDRLVLGEGIPGAPHDQLTTALTDVIKTLVSPGDVIQFTAQQVGDDVRLHVVSFDDSADTYTLREFALADATGLLAVYGEGTEVAVKGVAALHFEFDLTLANAEPGDVVIGPTAYLLPVATEAQTGVVQFATDVETAAGLAPDRAVSPLRLKDLVRTIASIAPLSKWQSKTAHGGYAGNFRAVAANGSTSMQIVLVGTAGEVQVSLDGHNYADEAPGLGYAGQYNAIARVGDAYIVCTNDGEIHKRTDVPAWSKLYVTGTGERFYCVAGHGTDGLVGGDNGATTPVITRGTNVTLAGAFDTFHGSVASQRINAAAHNGAEWRAVGQTGAGGHEFLALTGSQWNVVASGAGVIADITYGKGLFVAVGTSTIKTSPDGSTWTTRTSRLSLVTTGDRVAFNPNVGVFIHTKSDGTAELSLDGITWTECSLTDDIASPSCLGLALTDRRAITVGSSGKIQASNRLPFTV